MFFEQDQIEIITPRKRQQVEDFLSQRDLVLDADVELTIGLFRDTVLLGTASLAGNV